MNLIKKVVLGAGIIGLPLFGTGQISKKQFRQMQSELGIKYLSELRNLGQGYWTKNDPETQSSLRLYSAIQNGDVYSNGKTNIVKGNSQVFLSKESLEKIDNGDYVITKKEIEDEIKKEYIRAFEKYAQSRLGVEKENITSLSGGYKTSSSLKEKLTSLTEITENLFNLSPEEMYDIISKKDAVITKQEIISGAKAINNYLKKQNN